MLLAPQPSSGRRAGENAWMAAGFGIVQIGFRLVDRTPLRRLAGIRMTKSSTARRENAQRSRERDPSLRLFAILHVRPCLQDLDRLIHERIRRELSAALAVNRSLTFSELKARAENYRWQLSVHAAQAGRGRYTCLARSPLTGACQKTASTAW